MDIKFFRFMQDNDPSCDSICLLSAGRSAHAEVMLTVDIADILLRSIGHNLWLKIEVGDSGEA